MEFALTTISACERNQSKGSCTDTFTQELVNLLKADWHEELHRDRTDRGSAYGPTFWSGNPNEVKGLEERWKKYSACLGYNIVLLRQTPQKLDQLPKEPNEFIQALKQQVANYGMEVDREYHKLSVFQNVIAEIAKAFFSTVDTVAPSRELNIFQSIAVARRTIQKCLLELPTLQKACEENKAAYDSFMEKHRDDDVPYSGLGVYGSYMAALDNLKKVQNQIKESQDFLDRVARELGQS